MNGAAIAIFDTNPKLSDQTITAPQNIKDQLDTFEVHGSYASFPDPDDGSWLKDHAAFIAGIVHSIAPESEVHFIPVLDDHACGDLFTLIYSMQNFNIDTINNDVRFIFNLSLGIEHPGAQIDEIELESTRRGIRFKRIKDYLSNKNVNAEMIKLYIRVLLAPVETLEAVVQEVTSSGNLVVAAAGNDSKRPADVLEPNLPAAFDDVIGVGASTLQGNHACYSNSADIYAPGGDGSQDECLPVSAECSDPNCPYGVVSWSMFTRTGYRFWSGTSFSTAIVSGLIANPSPSSQ